MRTNMRPTGDRQVNEKPFRIAINLRESAPFYPLDLQKTEKKEPAGSPLVASTKSERAEADCAAPMGRGATATIERLAASLGALDEAAPRFDPALDVSKGGVLLALPALLACGLLRHSGKYFRLPAGFYGLKTIFLLLAFMALARLKSIEALRYYAPGEWGKLLGLDRAPEVRTLRVKVKTLADQNQAFSWSSELGKKGWRRPRKRQLFSMLMAMFAFTTATPSNYPSTT